MYDLMRERGYYGGFMLDAISACDIALGTFAARYGAAGSSALLGGALSRAHPPGYVFRAARPDRGGAGRGGASFAAEGFSAFKLAAGHGVRADIKTSLHCATRWAMRRRFC